MWSLIFPEGWRPRCWNHLEGRSHCSLHPHDSLLICWSICVHLINMNMCLANAIKKIRRISFVHSPPPPPLIHSLLSSSQWVVIPSFFSFFFSHPSPSPMASIASIIRREPLRRAVGMQCAKWQLSDGYGITTPLPDYGTLQTIVKSEPCAAPMKANCETKVATSKPRPLLTDRWPLIFLRRCPYFLAHSGSWLSVQRNWLW